MSKEKKEKKEPPNGVEAAIALIEKRFGSGSIMQGEAIIPVDSTPTNIASLDMALGVAGIPDGRIIEMFGIESCGKTTVCLKTIASYQKAGHTCAFIDAEHALDPEWAKKIGVDLDKLLLAQPNCGEEALQIALDLANCGGVRLIVVDSVAALVPQSELDGEVSDNSIGAQARLMSKSMRQLNGACSKFNSTIIFINQIREKIGVMFGSPETTPGGRALKFYASCRIELRRGEPIKFKDDNIGHVLKAKIVKNKVAQPFKSCQFDVYYGDPRQLPIPVCGIDDTGGLIDAAQALKVVTLSGSWYAHDGQKLGNGRANAVIALANSEEWREKIRAEVYAAMRAHRVPALDKTDEEIVEGFDFDESGDFNPEEE